MWEWKTTQASNSGLSLTAPAFHLIPEHPSWRWKQTNDVLDHIIPRLQMYIYFENGNIWNIQRNNISPKLMLQRTATMQSGARRGSLGGPPPQGRRPLPHSTAASESSRENTGLAKSMQTRCRISIKSKVRLLYMSLPTISWSWILSLCHVLLSVTKG